MRKGRIVSLCVLLLMAIVAVPGSPSSSPICGPGNHVLLRLQDLTRLGIVDVITPERPIDQKTIIQGWTDARTTVLVVQSEKTGDYVAEIISSSYEFASPEAAQAAMAGAPYLRGVGGVQDGTVLLAPWIVSQLANRATQWNALHQVDEIGLHYYGFWVRIESYVAMAHITTFASTIADELSTSASASREEQIQEYNRILAEKQREGKHIADLVNHGRAQMIGKQVITSIAETLLARECANLWIRSGHG